jgi:hypothetical protein
VPGPLTAGIRSQIASQAPALDVDSLTLSALGATTNLHASLAVTDIADWHHIMSLGRDSYVRVVERFHLAPFCHRVVVVPVTERLPLTTAPGPGTIPPETVDGLLTVTRLVPITPVVDYTGAEATAVYSALGTMMNIPFRTVRLTDPVIPPIADPPLDRASIVTTPQGDPLMFHVVAEDLSGASVEMSLPMVLVPDGQDPTSYNSLPVAPAVLGGQNVAFVGAPGAVRTVLAQGDCSVQPVDTMSFTVQPPPGTVQPPPGGRNYPFLPLLDQAVVRVPAASAVTGGPAAEWIISYHPAYLSGGIDPATNRGTVFAKVTNSPPPLALGAGSAGGLAAPQLQIDGLSRTLGPVTGAQLPAGDGPGPLMSGQFDPTTLLASLEDAVLFGFIRLSDILEKIEDFDPSSHQVPAFVRTQLADSIRTTFTWNPPLQSTPALPTPGLAIDASTAALSLSVTIEAPLGAPSQAPPTSDISGELTSITLTFVGAVVVTIDRLAFHARHGSKVEFTMGPNVGISFAGDLWFLNVLANALPSNGFADPPHIEADSNGVTAGYSLGLPSIGIGIVSIQHIAFDATLSLPFTGPLGLRLAFSSREHPFMVSVAFIGGGGFFGVDVGADGVHLIEGAIELGADLSVDLAIVSADVHVLAGFYFAFDGSKTTFSAFFRIGGSISLLGLVGVSVELYLELGYNSDGSQIGGTASLTLSIQVLFVTKSVTLSVEKHFDSPGGQAPTGLTPPSAPAAIAGTPAPPGPIGFSDVMSPDDWVRYLGAFA